MGLLDAPISNVGLKDSTGALITPANPLPAELKNRTLIEVKFFDPSTTASSATFTDNQPKTSPILDLTAYRSVLFTASNTTDQDIRVSPMLAGATSYFWDGTANAWARYSTYGVGSDRYVVVPKQTVAFIYVLNTFFAELDGQPLKSMAWHAKPVTAAVTSGAFTLSAWGVKN